MKALIDIKLLSSIQHKVEERGKKKEECPFKEINGRMYIKAWAALAITSDGTLRRIKSGEIKDVHFVKVSDRKVYYELIPLLRYTDNIQIDEAA